MKEGLNFDLTHSLGLVIDKEAKVTSVLWDSPAFKAGVVNGAKLIAVNGVGYSKDVLTDAIKVAKTGSVPTRLIVQRGDRFDTLDIPYVGGMRYPHLERVGGASAPIDQLLVARRKP